MAKKMTRLQARYVEEVAPALIKTFGYKNVMQVPKIEKIILNQGLGEIKDNSKSIQLAVQEMEKISGQKAVMTKSRKSVANFKVRAGQNIGIKITLRGDKMWYFLDKLISIALPRVRDFKGVPKDSFDGRGNYAMGVKEQLLFPEINYEEIEKVHGFDVAIVTSAKTDEEARELLKLIGMPFAK